MSKYEEQNRIKLSQAIASWFVRRDGKYYEIDNFTTKLSLPDVQAICLERFAEDYPEIEFSRELLTATFKATFTSLSTSADQRVGTWNGKVVSEPGNTNRLVRHRGQVSINTWTEPAYRNLGINSADYGVAGEFFTWILPREAERQRVLDWLAWNLQHEDDKPAWALFLYSEKKGSGKSKFTALFEALIGKENVSRANSVSHLTSRFNMPTLTSKLVIAEEVKLQAGTQASNAMKTYITEPSSMSEMKGMEAQMVEQRCCFLLTSNHAPLWIEPDERRYYVLDIDHDGHASGDRTDDFIDLMVRLDELIADPAAVARLYNALMTRELAPDFNAKSLNIARHSTAIMQQIQRAAPQVSTERLREHLDAHALNSISEAELVDYVQRTLHGNVETIRHKMTELGWHREKLKWGGVDYDRVLWVRGGYSAYRGQLQAPDGSRSPITSAIEEEARL